MDRKQSRVDGEEGPRHILGLWARGLALFGLACWAWVGWSLAEAAAVEFRQGRQLEEARQAFAERSAEPERWASEPDPGWGDLVEGDLVGRVEIERIGVSAIILEGSTAPTLDRAVGRISDTGLPGRSGNVGLAGHRTTFFRALRGIDHGDIISVTTPHGDFRYSVDTTFVVQPEDVWVLDSPEDGEMITLVTCFPFDFIGPAPQRFIVQARRIDAQSPSLLEIGGR